MAIKKDKETIAIEIKPINIEKAKITIIGDTPLIVNAWSEKAKNEMLEAQQKNKKDKKAKEKRVPFEEFFDALYWITPKPEDKTEEAFEEAVLNGAKFGFPVIAVKQAALSACYRAGLIPNQTGMKCSFFLNAVSGGSAESGNELVEIETEEPPRCREDEVRLAGIERKANLRYRPEFRNWKMHLVVNLIDTGVFDMASIINAINMGGSMNGIGEWRMERDGDFGRFHVELTGGEA